MGGLGKGLRRRTNPRKGKGGFNSVNKTLKGGTSDTEPTVTTVRSRETREEDIQKLKEEKKSLLEEKT